ncbi:MAG: phage late control D family protein [Betaproteobacteria bacterium]|nr:phage late control D family protein [Betaproteobacteria bacterium]
MTQPRAVYSLIIDGKDRTLNIAPRLVELTHTDNRGLDADTLEFTIADHDGAVELPPRGAKIRFSLGWRHTGLVEKGEFTVTRISHSGAPDVLRICAASVDLREKIMQKKDASYHGKTVGEIIRKIAADNQLEPLVSPKLDKEAVGHIDQTGESDTNFLTRMAEQFDAIATVKAGKLLFILRGEATTASGKPLPEQTLTRRDGDRHCYEIDDGANYTAVTAYWHDRATGKKGEVTVDKNTKFVREHQITKTGKTSKRTHTVVKQPVQPSADKTKVLRHTYSTRTNAIRGAKAAFDKLQRGVATFNIDLAAGNPELFPEVPIRVQGFKREIDETAWLITKVTNRLDSAGGYTQNAEFEMRLNSAAQ